MKIKKTMQNRAVLTKENVKRLESELKTLVDTKRKEVIEELTSARKQGDLSENAEYEAALEKQAIIEGRINKIETVLRNSELAEKDMKGENNKNIVQIGKRVIIEKKNGEKIEYKIGTVSDIDVENRVISNNSPLGSALLNNVVGATVTVKKIKNPYEIKILKILE